MKMLKKSLSALVAICLFVSVIPAASAAAPLPQTEDIEITENAEYSGDVELICEVRTRDLSFDCNGGRQTKWINRVLMEQVWGWSTCKDAAGGEVYHYTVARYEDTIFGTASDDLSSGRVWGNGTVWAYSPFIDYEEVALTVKAKVYYGV